MTAWAAGRPCAYERCRRPVDIPPHHIRKRSLGGNDVLPSPEARGNLVPLCREHHDAADAGRLTIAWIERTRSWVAHDGVSETMCTSCDEAMAWEHGGWRCGCMGNFKREHKEALRRSFAAASELKDQLERG